MSPSSLSPPLPDRPLRRRASVQTEEVEATGECVLLEPSEGRVLALNPLGAALWGLLDGGRDARALAGVLSEATGISPEQAAGDVQGLLERLWSEGLLE